MMLKDSANLYGTLSKLLHWLTAAGMLGMFVLGYWMRTLDYYSPYYQSAPRIHESIGLLFFVFIPVFLIWRVGNINPDHGHLKPYERILANAMKVSLYALMAGLLVTGYLLSTLGDTPVMVFGWFGVPAIFTVNESKLLVGNIHQYCAYALMFLAFLHMTAALKHHFIDGDNTLIRILPFIKPKVTQETE